MQTLTFEATARRRAPTGMTSARAALSLALPAWIGVVFSFDVFAAIPTRLSTLAGVVPTAAGLFRSSRLAGRRGLLR